MRNLGEIFRSFEECDEFLYEYINNYLKFFLNYTIIEYS